MKRRRKTTDDERTLFRNAIDESRPLKAVTAKPKMKKPVLPARPGGLDGNTAARLKRGDAVPEARIDLHGQTEAVAHRSLLVFLERAHRNDARLVLVITGKGNPRAGEGWMASPHGILKQMVPRWLNEAPFAALVSGSGAAHIRHGGDGALYVYLRKAR